MKNKITAVTLSLAVAALLLLGGCSAQMSASAPSATSAPVAEINEFSAKDALLGDAGAQTTSMNKFQAADAPEAPESGEVYGSGAFTSLANSPQALDPGRKLIRNAALQAETTAFDETVGDVEALTGESGGYLESSSVMGNKRYLQYGDMRTAVFTIRVPVGNFEGFLRQIESLANVYSTQSSTQDATEQYVDTEARLNALKIMEERLLEMLSKATELKDVVSLEQTLAENRYEIERLTGSLRKIDSLASYSTVRIELNEVLEITENAEPTPVPKTLGQRIGANFSATGSNVIGGFEDFLVFFIGGAPVLLIWAVVLGVLALVFVKVVHSAKRKRAEREQQEKDT